MTDLETRLWHTTKFLDVASELAMQVIYEGRKHIEDLSAVDLFRFEQMQFPVYAACEHFDQSQGNDRGKSDVTKRVILLPFHFNDSNSTDREAIKTLLGENGNLWLFTYFKMFTEIYYRLCTNTAWNTLTQLPKMCLTKNENGVFIDRQNGMPLYDIPQTRIVPLEGYYGCEHVLRRAGWII